MAQEPDVGSALAAPPKRSWASRARPPRGDRLALLAEKRYAGYSVAVVVGGFAIWHLLARYVVDPFFLPTPGSVLQSYRDLLRNGTLIDHISASMSRIGIGWTIGSAVGALGGLAVGASRTARAIGDPYIHFFRFVPGLALIPLFIAWFGIGELSKIILVIYVTLFIVVINTATGVASIPDDKLHAARCLGAGSTGLFLRVRIPAAVPSIFVGMRLALSVSFLSIVAAELIAADRGLGFLIWNARLYLRTDWMFVGLFTLAGLGFLADRAWRTFGRLVLGRYLRDVGRY